MYALDVENIRWFDHVFRQDNFGKLARHRSMGRRRPLDPIIEMTGMGGVTTLGASDAKNKQRTLAPTEYLR
jgi:hypothetical protein